MNTSLINIRVTLRGSHYTTDRNRNYNIDSIRSFF